MATRIDWPTKQCTRVTGVALLQYSVTPLKGSQRLQSLLLFDVVNWDWEAVYEAASTPPRRISNMLHMNCNVLKKSTCLFCFETLDNQVLDRSWYLFLVLLRKQEHWARTNKKRTNSASTAGSLCRLKHHKMLCTRVHVLFYAQISNKLDSSHMFLDCQFPALYI